VAIKSRKLPHCRQLIRQTCKKANEKIASGYQKKKKEKRRKKKMVPDSNL